MIFHRAGIYSVVPITVKAVGMQINVVQLSIRNTSSFGVWPVVDFATYFKAGFGGSSRDQVDDDIMAV
jgi:hypothetical protein